MFISSAQDYVQNNVIVKFKSQEAVHVDGKHRMTAKRKATSQTLTAIGVSEAQLLMPLTAQKEAQAKMRQAQVAASGREQLVPKWHTPPQPVDVSQLYVLTIDTTLTSVTEAIEQLKALEEVEYAEPNYISRKRSNEVVDAQVKVGASKQRKVVTAEGIDYAATDELFEQQWNLHAIRIPELWEQPIIHQRRPIIALIDNGIDTTHVELKENLLPGLNTRDGSSDVWNTSWDQHGTATASIAAAVGGNGGMVGANPLAQIIPVKSGFIGSQIIQALDFAVAQGADVIFCSYGIYIYSQAESDAYQKAAESTIVVAAAGNEGFNLEKIDGDFPACYPGVIGVMNTNADGLLNDCNYDPNGAFYAENKNNYNYHLKAPGTKVLVATMDGKYQLANGTSFSTPLVAGAISRLLQCRDYSSREELLQALVESQGSHLDMMEAYRYTQPITDLFTRNISGKDITFRKISEHTLEVGDGINPYYTGEYSILTIPDVVAGYAVTSIAANAFNGVKVKKFLLPYMLDKVGSQAFAGTQVDTLCITGKAFRADINADAFTPLQYTECVLACTKPDILALQSSPTWSQFQHIDFNQFTVQLDGKDVLCTMNDTKLKTIKIGNNSEEQATTTAIQGVLTIPEEIYGFQVTEVAPYAFMDCKDLTELHLPNTITTIGNFAFRGCTSLTSITLPNQLEIFDHLLFAHCTSLTSLPFPQNLKTLGKQCLYNCGLKEIFLPEGLVSIEACALMTSSFTKCVLPKSVETLEEYCLASNIPYVLVTENPNPIPLVKTYGDGDEMFEDDILAFGGNLVRTSTLVVPAGSKSAYENAKVWNQFGRIVEGTAETDVQPLCHIVEHANGTYLLNPMTHEGTLWNILETAPAEFEIVDHLDSEGEHYTITNVNGSIDTKEQIQTLILPASLQSLEAGAFYHIPNVQTVISYIEEPFVLDENTFKQDFWEAVYPDTLYVPAGTKAKYEALDVWNQFGEIIEMDAEAVGIPHLTTLEGERLSDHPDEAWHTLQGIRLKSKPTSKGVYLHGEKKVIVQ